MSPIPSHDLELKAADERRRLHGSVVELKSHVRERLDIKKNASKNLGFAGGVAAVFGLLSGYLLAGIFVDHKSHNKSHK